MEDFGDGNGRGVHAGKYMIIRLAKARGRCTAARPIWAVRTLPKTRAARCLGALVNTIINGLHTMGVRKVRVHKLDALRINGLIKHDA